jgi:hypothetical protein
MLTAWATPVDDADRHAAIERHVQLAAEQEPIASHAIYHDDVVLEFPQCGIGSIRCHRPGERFEGVANFRE